LNAGFGVKGVKKMGRIEKMKKLKKKVSFSKNALGATAVEYAIIVSLVAVAVIGGAQYLGNMITNQFNTIANKIKGTIP
jgi:Flp pilus assembly pilin Flp